METAQTPFTNLQLELFKVFAMQVNENDLLEIKQMLTDYFAKKSIEAADKVWEEKGWTKEDELRMLNEHMRTPYLRNK